MKKILLDFLVCPACIIEKQQLQVSIGESEGDDIISGYLYCDRCDRKYPINNGVAVLLPDALTEINLSQKRYEEEKVISSYLWSHYSDLFHDVNANEAYSSWSSHFSETGSAALDTGCAVGRFTFELSNKSDFTIGVDRSYNFIRMARKLSLQKYLDFPLVMEGVLTEKRSIALPDRWDSRKVEFIVADVLALPFPTGTFDMISSLNILDKVSHPLTHLLEINRVADKKNARLLLSDPFSWSLDSAKTEDWLGGKKEGEYQGNGMDNVSLILTGKDNVMHPSWNLLKKGVEPWKIRNHQNHYEMIRSQFIVASR